MSGPIVRKYGFPNFEKIFGERDLQHGVDDESKPAEEPADAEGADTAPKAKKKATKPKKGSS